MGALRTRHSMKPSRRVSITSIMTALALIGNYWLVSIPNVELGSTILFATAFIFGFPMGITCVLLMSIIYASFNPWGSFMPQIWLAQVVGWAFMVAVGALMGRGRSKDSNSLLFRLELAAMGAFTTLFFDLVTTLGYSWAFEIPFTVALVTGLPFMIIHTMSNAFWFAAITPGLNSILKMHFQFAIWDEQMELIQEISEE